MCELYFSPRASRLVAGAAGSWAGRWELACIVGDLCPAGGWLAGRTTSKAKQDGWHSRGGGRASWQAHPTSLIACPSVIAHHRRCQAVRLTLEMQACPCFWSRSGLGRWLAGSAGLGVRLPTLAHGEPRYDILVGPRTGPAVNRSLGHIGAFPCSLSRNFLPFHLEYPATHTRTHTHTRTSFLSFLLPEHPTSLPPRARRFDLPPHDATPNASIYLHWCACCTSSN